MKCPTCGQHVAPPKKMRLDLNTGCIVVGDWIGRVAPRQAEVLHVLLTRSPEAVPMPYLIQRVYGINEPEKASEDVRSFIRHLKPRLMGSGYQIKNSYGFGYSLRPTAV